MVKKPKGATHITVERTFYKKANHNGKTWWYVWQQDAWWVVSGEPSVILFPVK